MMATIKGTTTTTAMPHVEIVDRIEIRKEVVVEFCVFEQGFER